MNTDIEPRHAINHPRPDRIAEVCLYGCCFVVGWDGEAADFERHYYFGVVGREHPVAWVECVKLDGKWWDAHEVFSSDFCDQLDAALMSLEEF